MRLQVLSKNGAGLEYLGFAKEKLKELADLRLQQNLPYLQRTLHFDGQAVKIFLHSSSWGDTIRISAATGDVFSVVATTGDKTYALGWLSITPAADGFFVGRPQQIAAFGASEVAPFAPERTVFIGEQAAQVTKTLTPLAAAIGPGRFHVPLYEKHAVAFLDNGSVFAAQGVDSQVLLAAGNVSGVGRSDGLPTAVRTEASGWNNINTQASTLIPLSGASTIYERSWTPKVFVGWPGSGYGIGEFVYGVREDWGAYIKVLFGGFFVDLTTDAAYRNHGVAEVLWQLGDSSSAPPIGWLYCYVGDADDSALRASYCDRTGFVGAQNNRLYNDQSGRHLAPTCQYDLNSFVAAGETESSLHHYGYILGSGRIVSLVVGDISRRFDIYVDGSFVVTGEYRWHSTSSDGALLAVGTDYGLCVVDCGIGVVFDGSKRPSSGIVLRKILAADFGDTVAGAILPQFGVTIDAAGEPYDFTVEPPIDTTLPDRDTRFDACFGGVEHIYPRGYASSMSGWKLSIETEDGRSVAVGQRWVDPCFQQSSYTVLYQDGAHDTYAVTVDGVQYSAGSFAALADVLPYFLALFTEVDPNEIALASWSAAGLPSAVAASPGVGVRVETFARAGISILGPLIEGYGCGDDAYEVSENATSPYSWSISSGLELVTCTGEPVTGAIPDSIVAVQVEPICADYATLSVEDGCGLSYARDIPIPKTLLTVRGASHATVGEEYSAGGGVGPYSFSFSAGSIDAVTGEILSISACSSPGDLRTGFVSVIDACGARAEKEVTLPGGVWVLIAADVQLETWAAASPDCWCIETLVSGKTMEKIKWAPYCSTITCEMHGFDLGSTCTSDTVYVGGLDDECGNPPLAGYSGAGGWECFVDPGFTGDCGLVRYYPTPAYSVILGYKGYGRYSKNVYEWRCP